MPRPKTIVILDDEALPLKQLGKRARRAGFAVHTAGSVDEFTKIVKTERIDYALVDLKVDYRSSLGGLDALAFLKRNQPWSKVIVVTGTADVEDKVLREGADGYVHKTGPGNYIEVVLAKLLEFESLSPRRDCFAVMPMSATVSCTESEWTYVFQEMVKPAMQAAGFDCRRSSGVVGNIIKQVLADLNSADLVIADLTDLNANVFYELGVRHALRDRTILIAQSLEHVPFDLQAYGVILYDWKTPQGRDKFIVDISVVIALFERQPERAISPVLEYLQPSRSDATPAGPPAGWRALS